MDDIIYTSFIKNFNCPKNTKNRYIKIADMLLMNFMDSTLSAAKRFEEIEKMCRWGVYLIGADECKKIINLIINNIPNVINDEYDIKYYQKNLRRYKKYYLNE